MLGKLLKHELKQTVRSVSTIYIVLAVIAAFLLLSSLVGANAFKAISNAALFVATIVMIVMTVVAVIKNFHDSLYGRQGYLSFTLPVKCSSLLLSKIIVSAFWLLCAVILMGIVYFIMYIAMTGENGIELLGSLKDMIEGMGIADLLPSKTAIAKLLIFAALGLLLEFTVIIGLIYFSVTVANTRPLQAHPKAFGILVFLGIYMALTAIANPLSEKVPLSIEISATDVMLRFVRMGDSPEMLSFGISGLILRAAVAVVLLVVTGWIMENKVNVK